MAHNFALHMPPFDPDADVGASVAPKWKLWVSDFTTFLVAHDITDPKRKRALLLFLTGPRVRDIFQQLPDTGEHGDFGTALTCLNIYFEPLNNQVHEVYKFRQSTQAPQETIDQFHTRLRGLGETCEFHDLDFEIMLQIVQHGTSSHLCKQALHNNNLTLQQLLLLGRQEEMSRFQAADIEGKETEDVNYFQKKMSTKKSTNPRNTSQASARKTCHNCRGEWPHQNGKCPANGQKCRKCHKLNHFARKCRSKEKRPPQASQTTIVRPLDVTGNSSDSEMEYCYALDTE